MFPGFAAILNTECTNPYNGFIKISLRGETGQSYSLPFQLCDTSADYPTSKSLAAVHICLWGQCNMDTHFN